ncbi:hypothetical protein AAZX31_04G165500 [Glycine max]
MVGRKIVFYGFFSKLFFCVFVFRLLGLAKKPKRSCLVVFSFERKTQRPKLFGLVWQFFAWVGRKMIFGFFSRLSFCVLVFHMLGSFSIDFWVLFQTILLRFFFSFAWFGRKTQRLLLGCFLF